MQTTCPYTHSLTLVALTWRVILDVGTQLTEDWPVFNHFKPDRAPAALKKSNQALIGKSGSAVLRTNNGDPDHTRLCRSRHCLG